MRILRAGLYTFILVFVLQSVSVAQSLDLTETFKKSFNETVQEVQKTENASEKRTLLNESFSNMLLAIERIEAKANLSEEEIARLAAYKSQIQDKKSELNGTGGFDKVPDKDLNEFTDYSQQYLEQADKTLTISLTAALLIILILLLL